MLGWPLVNHVDDGLSKVSKEKLYDDTAYTVYRMSFNVIDEIQIYGLYFELKGEVKKPLVLVQHGALGSPEHISGFYGSTDNYNKILERVIAHGVHAFAPQLLIWDKAKYDVDYDRTSIDAKLKRVGSSITALECYALSRILDYFQAQDNVSNFGMVGLSYGGFFTLCFTAIDTRVKSAISCSYFNTRDKYPWADWVWFGSAEKFDDAEVACLVYPRKLCIEIGKKDPLFDVEYGIKSFEKLTKMSKNVGTDWLNFIVFDGEHEFCLDDKPIEDLIKDISK